MIEVVTNLVPSGPHRGESIDDLRSRLAERQALLAERSAEHARVQSDLAAFRIRYRQDVGLLHEELDELERAIAQAELGELSKVVPEDTGDAPTAAAGETDLPPRYTSDAVRRLFRDVAKTIHPDLASDEQTRDRRHTLMVEANRAYALGDEERLRWILEAWERSPEAVQGSDLEAMRLRLVRRIAEIEEQLHVCASELAAMQASALWQLKAMVDAASANGKDLVRDMVRRLQRDITAARNRLDAMLWNP
jgi:hypothetical protein